MRLLSEMQERLRALVHRNSDERAMAAELRFHVDMQAEEYVRQGMSPEEARRQAALDFGGMERVKEEVRDARGLGVLESTARDVGYAVRSFRSGRSGLVMSVAVLAVAIAAGTTIFSVVSGVLLSSLPFTEPERLVSVRVAPLGQSPEDIGGATLSQRSLELFLSGERVFESAVYFHGSGEPVLTGIGEPERVSAWSVAPQFFEVLGSRPILGRMLTPADAAEGAGAPVVLSYRFWVSHFGGSDEVIGRTIRLDGKIHEVVGVMPAGFDYPEGAELWQPAPPVLTDPGPDPVQGRYWLVGRLAAGVSAEQARTRLDELFVAYGREHSDFAKWRPNVAPLREVLIGAARKPLLLLLGTVALVLLVACANVAAVLLARGVTRRRELAIRISMGATRTRVARQLVWEAVLVALASGTAGTFLAVAGVPLLVSLMGDQIPGTARIAMDARVLLVTLAASTVTGLVAGVLPALLVARENISTALYDGGSGTGISSWRTRMGEALVVLQVSLGTVLLTAGVLLALSFVNLMGVDFGFDPARVAVAQLRLPQDRYDSAEQRRMFIAQVLERVAAIPGAQAAAVSNGIPFEGAAMGSVEIPGEEIPPSRPLVWFNDVTPEYFRTLGMVLLRGRDLTREGRGQMGAVVVNEAFARAYFGTKDPIGRTVAYYGGSRKGRVIGVVTDTRQKSLAEPAPPQLYSLLDDGSYLKVSIRSVGDPRGLLMALKRTIRSVDPLLPIDRVSVLTELVDESVARQRFYAGVISSFALIAMLITALGIYGLTGYSVARRSREIGIRLAIGATVKHIRTTIIGRAALLAGIGIALGLTGAWMGARLLNAFVFGLSTSDPLVFASVAVLLMLATVAAAFAPARRATRVDPMVVLRTD